MDYNNEKLVVLDTYHESIEASMAKGVLETNGIPCMISNEVMNSLYGPASLWEPRIYVFECDLERARKVMAASPIAPLDDN